MEAFLGQIQVVPYNFAPANWALCNGQLLSISQNTALFSLLGTQYGGDGRQTFALPNFQSYVVLGSGSGPGLSNYVNGEVIGTASCTLIAAEMPAHAHSVEGTTASASSSSPAGNIFGATGGRGHGAAYYVPYVPANNVAMATAGLGLTGGNQPHNNLMPSLVMNYIIALSGIFPQRN